MEGNGKYNMSPSQPYAQASHPPPPQQQKQQQQYENNNPENGGGPRYGDTAPFSQANEKTGARFQPKKRLNDPIFLVLFIASFAGFVVLSAISIKTFIDQNGLGGGFGTGEGGNSATLD